MKNKVIIKILDALIKIIYGQISIERRIEELQSYSRMCTIHSSYAVESNLINELSALKKELSADKDKKDTTENKKFKNEIIQISPDEVFTYLSKGYRVIKMDIKTFFRVNLAEYNIREIHKELKDENNINIYFILESDKETTHKE